MEINPVVTSVDPVTFEILSHRLYQIAREMGTALERVGGTVNTTQMHDYMASLYLANGDVLSAGDSAGWHVACAGFAVKRIIERFEKDAGINPNDIFLLNDPYLAAIHQSDVYMISPIHFKGKLMGWSAVSSLTRSVQGNKVEQEGPNRPQPQPLRLESKTTAILVLDLSSRCENPKEVCFQLMERLGRFLDRARQSSIPILFTISAAAKGTPLGEVAELLRRRQTEPVYIRMRSTSSWAESCRIS